jgi:hypothetical protein
MHLSNEHLKALHKSLSLHSCHMQQTDMQAVVRDYEDLLANRFATAKE